MNTPIYLKPLAEEAKKYNTANGFIGALKRTIHKEEVREEFKLKEDCNEENN